MNSAALPLPIAMLAFITLRNNCLLFIDLVQFCAGFLSKNKINATPVPLLVFFCYSNLYNFTVPGKYLLEAAVDQGWGQVGHTHCARTWGQSTSQVLRRAGPGDEKSTSPQLARGSTPPACRPLHLPWHHRSLSLMHFLCLVIVQGLACSKQGPSKRVEFSKHLWPDHM